MYKSERSFVRQLATALRKSLVWGELRTRCEFPYNGGRTDVIGLRNNAEVIAFEAKLLDWRVALQQAYRSTFFANRVYVVLPKKAAERAERFTVEFQRRGVGLCCLHRGSLTVLSDIDASDELLQPWMHREARNFVLSCRRGKRP